MNRTVFLLTACTLLGLAASCFAQENLIRNGSFEELSRCPDGNYNFPAKNWFVLQGTPDLFASCAPRNSVLAVPTNFNGTRSTLAGYNYAGIFLVFVAKSCKEKNCYLASESISTHLTKALKAGKRYKISLMLSLADSAVFRTDSLFCSLSTEAPVAAKMIKQDETRHRFKRSDTYGCSIQFACGGCWNKVEVEFTAKDAYTYLAIGLPRTHYSRATYRQDVARPLQPLPANKWAQSVAYYYLDDVQLTEE